GDRRQRSGLSDRSVRADLQLGRRSGLSAESVLLHSDARNRAPARRGAESLAGHERIPARILHAAWVAVRRDARRPRHDVSRIHRPDAHAMRPAFLIAMVVLAASTSMLLHAQPALETL